MKKALAVLLLLCMILSITVIAQDTDELCRGVIVLQVDNLNAMVKGEIKKIDVAPIIINGRTLLPLRFVAEAVGSEVLWDENTKTVTLTGTKKVAAVIGENELLVDDKKAELDTPAQIIGGRTLLPLRAIVEALGKKVTWEADKKIIIISDSELTNFDVQGMLDRLNGKVIVAKAVLKEAADVSGKYQAAKDTADFKKLSVYTLFNSGAVLQRNKTVTIWGNGFPGVLVTAQINGQKQSGLTNPNGEWEIKLDPMKEGGPYNLKVSNAYGEVVESDNVMIGDVWVCAGQSNMNVILAGDSDYQNTNANINGNVREYRVAMPPTVNNPENQTGQLKWTIAETNKANSMSAVAYYFADKIAKTNGVTVGTLVISCGDTRIEAFQSLDYLSSYGGAVAEYANERAKQANVIYKTSAFYDLCVVPVSKMAIKGFLWYQGESNDKNGQDIYAQMLMSLIENWRDVFGDSKLPFHIVELPNYLEETDARAKIRQAQLDVSKLVEGVTISVNMDLGNNFDIIQNYPSQGQVFRNTAHPKDKKEVGYRAANEVLTSVYGVKGLVGAPIIQKMEKSQGKITLIFDNRNSKGLKLNGDITEIEALINGNYVSIPRAQISVANNILTITGVKDDVTSIRYGWKNNPQVFLLNEEGIPASPFEIK